MSALEELGKGYLLEISSSVQTLVTPGYAPLCYRLGDLKKVSKRAYSQYHLSRLKFVRGSSATALEQLY